MMHGKNYKTMSAENKSYQAKEDCRTLVEAEAIEKDRPRLKAAIKHAKEKIKELEYVAEEGATEDSAMNEKTDMKGNRNG